MKDVTIQAGLCFVATFFNLYLLAWLDYHSVTVFSLTVLLVCLFLITFRPQKFILGGFLAGALAGSLELQQIFDFSPWSTNFLWLTLSLTLVTGVFYFLTFWLLEKFNLYSFYGNGLILWLLAFVSNLFFLVVTKYGLGLGNWNWIDPAGFFASLNWWYSLIIPIGLVASLAGWRAGEQVQSFYNQYGLVVVISLVLAGSMLSGGLAKMGPEISLVWALGIFIGLTRLPEFGHVRQYAASGLLFSSAFLLLQGLLPNTPTFFGLLAFVSVALIQKILPEKSRTSDQINNPTTNLSSAEAYYQTQPR